MPRINRSKVQSESNNELSQELIDDIQQPSSSASTNEDEASMIPEKNKKR